MECHLQLVFLSEKFNSNILLQFFSLIEKDSSILKTEKKRVKYGWYIYCLPLKTEGAFGGISVLIWFTDSNLMPCSPLCYMA